MTLSLFSTVPRLQSFPGFQRRFSFEPVHDQRCDPAHRECDAQRADCTGERFHGIRLLALRVEIFGLTLRGVDVTGSSQTRKILLKSVALAIPLVLFALELNVVGLEFADALV